MRKLRKIFHSVSFGNSAKLTCKVCGQKHTGVYSADVCVDCYKKGLG